MLNPSGTISQAQSYIKLASNMMGEGWVNSSTFRIGASNLLAEILSAETSRPVGYR